jgi:hypothetical protein
MGIFYLEHLHFSQMCLQAPQVNTVSQLFDAHVHKWRNTRNDFFQFDERLTCLP